MIAKTIEKPKRGWAVAPNLLDYEKVCAGFSWDAARRELDGLPGGRGLNIAHEAIDRHAAGAMRNHLALRWIGKGGETFAAMMQAADLRDGDDSSDPAWPDQDR
jgi:hypothetical protein